MAEMTLPINNAISDLARSTSESNQRLASSMSGGLTNVRNSIANLENNLTSIASSQLRNLKDQIEQDAAFQRESIAVQSQDRTSILDWINTFFNFQNKEANQNTEDLIKAFTKLNKSITASTAGQMGMFYEMGQTLLAMNKKLADIAAHTMYQLDFFMRQERDAIAGIGSVRGKKRSMAAGNVIDPSFVGPIQKMFYDFRGAVSKQERQMAVERMARSIEITKTRQMKGEGTAERSAELTKHYIFTMDKLGSVVSDQVNAIRLGFNTANEEQQKTTQSIENETASRIGEDKKDDSVQEEQTGLLKRSVEWLKKTYKLTSDAAETAMNAPSITSGLLSLFGIGDGSKTVGAMAAGITWKALAGAATLIKNPYVAATLLAFAAMKYFEDDFKIPEAPKKEELPKMFDEQDARRRREDEIAVELDKFEKGETYLTPDQRKALEDELEMLRAEEAKMKELMDSYYRQKSLDANKAYNESTFKGGPEEEAKKLGITLDEYQWRKKNNKLSKKPSMRISPVSSIPKKLSPEEIQSLTNMSSTKKPDGAEVNGRSSSMANQPAVIPVPVPATGGTGDTNIKVEQNRTINTPLSTNKPATYLP